MHGVNLLIPKKLIDLIHYSYNLSKNTFPLSDGSSNIFCMLVINVVNTFINNKYISYNTGKSALLIYMHDARGRVHIYQAMYEFRCYN